MNMTLRMKWITLFLWMTIFPCGLFFLYVYYPPMIDDWSMFAGFVFLALLTSFFPFIVNGTPMYFIHWVNLAVFLKYGIFVEVVVLQLTIIPFLYRAKATLHDAYRVPFNSLMFFFASLLSGLIYMGIGGQFGSLHVAHLLVYGFVYHFSSIFINHILLYVALSVFGERKKSFISGDTVWDYAGLILTFPLGISLYLLVENVGMIGFLLLGIPFFMMTMLLMMYNSAEKVNQQLNVASEIGYQLADRLTAREILDVFTEQLSKMLPIDYVYIVDILNDELVILRAFEEGQTKEIHFPGEVLANSLLKKVYEKEKFVLFQKRREWEAMPTPFLPADAQSVIALPISRNKKMEGILCVAAKKRNNFEQYQLQILSLLCSYFAVSLEKSKYVQEALKKSERCGLTGLYNFRYFDEQLERSFQKLLRSELDELSLIMMDIDYFKLVNDTYGHQSGNDILFGLARELEKAIGDKGILARYGGEEFVILLPNMSKMEALDLAEQLREKIAEEPFFLRSDLDDARVVQEVYITVSVGVATAPEDCDEALALIRNADRALYVGAKRAGRNRVAGYVK